MLAVNHSGMSFDVRFRFIHGEGRYKDCMQTTCDICVVDETKTGKEKYSPIVSASVRRNHQDAPSRGVGRRMALDKALQSGDYLFSKGVRAQFWQWYFNNHSDRVGKRAKKNVN